MPPRSRTAPARTARPISVTAVVDAVGALASGALEGHVYLYDTNKSAGSTGHGTGQLLTHVARGDQVIWNALALECEAYVAIDSIAIDPEVCEPERRVYPGSDIPYWIGTVKAEVAERIDYRIAFRLGTRTEPLSTDRGPGLAG